jgi:bifunctional DNA-binding transcriptional regulator/antitoxin component of YhaV-PrlF toxin-antitoxin module
VAKVTSKLQVTVPRALADRYGIQPGDEIDWEPAGDAIRVVPARRRALATSVEQRLALFDRAEQRQRRRERARGARRRARERGWRREDLYRRGRSR